MEFPDLGAHCSEPSCRKLDFLPMKCDGCHKLFCCNHLAYRRHGCASGHDVQVPLCPLCGVAVPGKRGERPDVAVGSHIDSDCRTDKNRIFKNRCSHTGCRGRELVPMLCAVCGLNFCVRHRHTADHACAGHRQPHRTKSAEAALRRSQDTATAPKLRQRVTVSDIQGNMSEDEALARALSLSMQPEQETQHRCNVS